MICMLIVIYRIDCIEELFTTPLIPKILMVIENFEDLMI